MDLIPGERHAMDGVAGNKHKDNVTPGMACKDFLIAPVAQLDRVPGYEPGGRRFESFRARHIKRVLI